ENDLAAFSSRWIFELVLHRSPVRFGCFGPGPNEDDRRIPGHPIVKILLRASIFERGSGVALEVLLGSLTLHLNNAVGYFASRGVADFNIAVNSGLQTG